MSDVQITITFYSVIAYYFIAARKLHYCESPKNT